MKIVSAFKLLIILSKKLQSGLFERALNTLLVLFQKIVDFFSKNDFTVPARVSCSRFIWVINSSDHRRVSAANLLHTKYLPIPLGHKTNGLVG